MKKLLIVLLLLGAALAGGTYYLSAARSPVNGDDFRLEDVQRGTITESVSSTGYLQPQKIIAVGSEAQGRVAHIYPNADFNREVEEGEPLLQLDVSLVQQAHDEAQAAVTSAEAALAAARSDLTRAEAGRYAAELKVERLKDLVNREVGFRKELDEALVLQKQAEAGVSAAQSGIKAAQAAVERAQAARSKAQLGVDLATVKVPTERNGNEQASQEKRRYTVLDRKVVHGQLIGPPVSAQLFTLASDLGDMQVHAQVAEGDVTKIKVGLDATFTIHGYSEEQRFRGKVTQIRLTPTNVQGAIFYTTIIDVKNARDPNTNEWQLRPGMTAAVDISLREHKDVWKVPTKALSLQMDKEHQSEVAKQKLVQWQARKDADDWRPVWILDQTKKPWPIFVRIAGKNADGEFGLKDGQFNEVLEWEPDLKPKPDPADPKTWPRVIVDAPPAQKSGFFSKQVKLF
jgi:HlyD family secretion protein